MQGVNLRDIDKLSPREQEQFGRWQREYMNKEYYRQLRMRAIAKQRLELGEIEYELNREETRGQ